MTRTAYLATVIACYLSAPDTPDRASRSDWAVASTLFRQNVPLANIQHAIRLAALRRQDSANLGPISSLAYFRQVAFRLTKREMDPAYVRYVNSKFQQRITAHDSGDTGSAASKPESRGL